MRLTMLLLLLLVLAGCNDRRSFDERFDDAQRNLDERAQNLDAAINAGEGVNTGRVADR